MDQTSLQSISEIIQHIIGKITDDSDVVYEEFDSPKKLREEFERDGIGLLNGKAEVLEKFNLWFAPTSKIGEIALSNDWEKEYLELAQKFDLLYQKIKN